MLQICPHRPRCIARYGLPAILAIAVHGAVLLCPGTRPAGGGPAGSGDAAGAATVALAGVELTALELALLADTPPRDPEESPAAALETTTLLEPVPEPERHVAAELLICEAAPPASAKCPWIVATAAADNAASAAALQRALLLAGPRLTAGTGQAGGRGRGRQNAGPGDGTSDLLELPQLDREPLLIRVPEFQFPAHLSRQGIHAGRVTVVVRVDARGRVSLLSITESSHPDLIPAVCEAAPKALFQPPVRLGRPVALRYSWTLELKDRTLDPEQRTL